MYYLAAPQAKTGIKQQEIDPDKLKENESLAKSLEEIGFKIILPCRDIDQSLPGKEILNKELEKIKASEGVIVVLSDTRGVYLEAGYAKALGKKLIGLKTEEFREMSEWGYAFFDYIASSKEELIEYLNSLPG